MEHKDHAFCFVEVSEAKVDPGRSVESIEPWHGVSNPYDNDEIEENYTREHKAYRGVKRERNETKAEQRKRQRNSGLAYTSTKGTKVENKTFQNIDCGCRKLCARRITENERKQIFDSFWGMGCYASQNAYLCGLVQQTTPKKRRPRTSTGKLKTSSNIYSLPIDGEHIEVCKMYFLQSLQISNGRMTRAVKKVRIGQPPGSDARGRHTPGTKISDKRMDFVRDHIASFPVQKKSKNSSVGYLASHLNIRLMHQLYKTHCLTEPDMEPVKECIYRRTFSHEFKLRFLPAVKETTTVAKSSMRSANLGNEVRQSFFQ